MVWQTPGKISYSKQFYTRSKMIRFKDIRIPKPCTVDYDSLPYNDVKRFCNSCAKHVYDFRGKDEVYFNSIINMHGKVCGIFYKDDIQSTTIKIKHPFYYTFIAKLVGVFLFFKTLLSSDYAQASNIKLDNVSQQFNDSTGFNVEIKNKHNYYVSYSMDIFINDTLYKSGNNLDKDTGFILLPDSLKKNDKIKVVIHGSKRKFDKHVYKIKSREYNFIYSNSNKITIPITAKRKAILIKKSKPQAAGYMYY